MNSLKDNSELSNWVNQTLANSVKALAKRGIVESQLVEAKPAWVFPFSIMIGKVRESTTHAKFLWFANSSELVHFAGEQVAETARDAARYFAMKWQLDAQKLYADKNSDDVLADTLSEHSESLLELVANDEFWVKSD